MTEELSVVDQLQKFSVLATERIPCTKQVSGKHGFMRAEGQEKRQFPLSTSENVIKTCPRC